MNNFKRKALFTAILAGLAAGCHSLPERAASGKASEKDMSVDCVTWKQMVGPDVGLLSMEIDAGVIEHGSVKVECGQNKVTVTNKNSLIR
jgi:hypothetical protein